MKIEKTCVYLITGFLGSGKTTLLNRMIDAFPPDKKLTVLVNEFGEIGVDGALVEGDEIEMMEICKGSIFCVCVKTDFIKGLYELHSKVQPDVLLIESTGVADPTDLKKDLKLPLFNDRFHFTEQFCVIDAEHFIDAFEVYASLEKQIASSTIFIINKTDRASREAIDETQKVIRRFHPDPPILETTYADIPLTSFFKLAGSASSAADTHQSKKAVAVRLSDEKLVQFIDDFLKNPNLEIKPPDTLVSAVYHWQGDDLKQIRALAKALPTSIVRAKGFVEEDRRMYVFNYVMGTWTVEKTAVAKEHIKHKNIVVFIGPPESMAELDRAFGTGNWSGMGAFQPFRYSMFNLSRPVITP
jgi:G3E family GTPase